LFGAKSFMSKDKITENPHSLPYAHTVGGVVIKPIDKGKIKGRSLVAMYEQTDMQLNQIKKQIELLAEQATAIQKRIEVSEIIYQSEINFQPIVGHIYHLYEKSDGTHVLSIISPSEWGEKLPFAFKNSVRLLGDKTWEILYL
jgi:hypothetical protein